MAQTPLTVLFVLLLFNASIQITHAENTQLNETQTKIKSIDAKINRLKHALNSTQDKRNLLYNELAKTEKQIGENTHTLQATQQTARIKEKNIASLQQQIMQANHQLQNQQQLLAKHICSRQKLGDYQPVKWVLNQDNLYSINRVLAFHQYLIKSRQTVIQAIQDTQHHLIKNQLHLKKEFAEQQQLQAALALQQQQLSKEKQYHLAVVQSLNKEIRNKQHLLEEYQQNKQNLTQIVKNLALENQTQQKILPVTLAFHHLQHKLPLPVNAQASQKMNQGITFFAPEGAPVHAIYPGRIVFSDWLKGYGLLLILDHGQGFMTLYAHNLSLHKQKGATVSQGEQIAVVGHSGGLSQNGLYFEIRHHGKAIPPLDWLTKKTS